MKDDHPGDDRLVAFSLDELAPPEAERTARHADECEACGRAVAVYRAVADAVRAAPAPAAPSAPLVSLLEEQAASVRPRRIAPAWAAAAAAVVVLAVAGGFWAGRRSVDAPAPVPRAVTIDEAATVPASLPEPPQIPFSPA